MQTVLDSSLLYKIPFFITLFVISIRLLLPILCRGVYQLLKIFRWHFTIFADIVEFIGRKTYPDWFLLKTISGFLLILFGGYITQLDNALFDFFGAFFTAFGYQIFLWSFGITSEFIANKINDGKVGPFLNRYTREEWYLQELQERDKKRIFEKDLNTLEFQKEVELYNQSLDLIHSRYKKELESLSIEELKELIDLSKGTHYSTYTTGEIFYKYNAIRNLSISKKLHSLIQNKSKDI